MLSNIWKRNEHQRHRCKNKEVFKSFCKVFTYGKELSFNIKVLQVFIDDSKPKEICSHCLIKLNELCDFITLCHNSNAKFDGMLYEYEELDNTFHTKTDKTSNSQKNGVIVASKNISETLTDCTDLIMMVQCKNGPILPLDSFDIQNCTINEHNMLSVTNDLSIEPFVNSATINRICNSEKMHPDDCLNNQTVLRYSREAYNGASENNHRYLQTEDIGEMVLGNRNVRNVTLSPLNDNETRKKVKVLNEYVINTTVSNIEPSAYQTRCSSFKNGFEDDKQITNHCDLDLNVNFNNPTVTNIDNSKPTVLRVKPRKLNSKVKNEKTSRNNKKSFPCPNCDKVFVRKPSLNIHMSLHTNFRPFECKVCFKSFAVHWDLKSHERIHTNIYKCHYCPKTFTIPSKLERHERIHTNCRPYACTIEGCNKTFSDKRNLVGHVVAHSDVRNFTCEVCNKKYKTKSQLNDHKKAHKDETPFQCHICSKSYKWKTNLIIHLKKHNGYKCAYCNKDCEKLCILVKHQKECKIKTIS